VLFEFARIAWGTGEENHRSKRGNPISMTPLSAGKKKAPRLPCIAEMGKGREKEKKGGRPVVGFFQKERGRGAFVNSVAGGV